MAWTEIIKVLLVCKVLATEDKAPCSGMLSGPLTSSRHVLLTLGLESRGEYRQWSYEIL